MKFFYKVLLSQNQSVNGNQQLTVTYSTHHWTKPIVPNSGLYVFDSYENALYALNKFGTQIWECVVKNPRKVKYLIDVDKLNVHEVAKLVNAKRFHRKLDRDNFTNPPKGTVLCDYVKLIKQVYPVKS